jgi:SAM-dependent methyltransferase
VEQDFSAAIDRDRLRFILDQQAHCDRYLASIADPKGKEVLVVGAGAGTDLLWCLKRGAASVTGIDIKPQPSTALEQALGSAADDGRYRVLEMGIEVAGILDQKFDLVISNNVFEHLPDVSRALEVCRDLVRPESGRIAIFSSPLFYSSRGSHLEHLPWEHLWGDPEELRQKLLKAGDLSEYHALHWADIPHFFEEIGLNRLCIVDFLAMVQKAGLVILDFGIVQDRHLGRLKEFHSRLAPVCEAAGVTVTDLTVEGFWIEMAVPSRGTDDSFPTPLEAGGSNQGPSSLIAGLPRSQERLRELEELLRDVENSVSLRLGRLLTAPFRKLRSLVSGYR